MTFLGVQGGLFQLSLKCFTCESHCNEYPSLRDSQVKAKGDEASFEV